jgi:hypothetical protein
MKEMDELKARKRSDTIRRLIEQTGCELIEAQRALYLRDGIYEFAKEWITCHGLSDTLTEPQRYPKWYAHLKARSKK